MILIMGMLGMQIVKKNNKNQLPMILIMGV
jgi:hypothetical protein